MPYNRQIPDAPIALSMLPSVAAADLTLETLVDSEFVYQGKFSNLSKSHTFLTSSLFVS